MASNTRKTLRNMRPINHKVTPIGMMGRDPLVLPNYSGAAHHSRSHLEDYNANNITAKSIDVDHTATENDEHAVEIDCDAAGFGDVKALNINYVTGAISAGEDEEDNYL